MSHMRGPRSGAAHATLRCPTARLLACSQPDFSSLPPVSCQHWPSAARTTPHGARQSRGAQQLQHVMSSDHQHAAASPLVKDRPAQQEAAKHPAAVETQQQQGDTTGLQPTPKLSTTLRHGFSHNLGSVCSTFESWFAAHFRRNVSHKPAWHGTQQEGCICTLLVGSMLLQLVQAHALLPPASSLGALPSLDTHHWGAPARGVLVFPKPCYLAGLQPAMHQVQWGLSHRPSPSQYLSPMDV